jgi:hypothetical protein
MLGRVVPDGITRDVAIDTFLRELVPLSAGGAALILDDFHLVDDASEKGAS